MIAHTPGEEWFVGETGHYHKCTVCETALPEEDHIESTDERAQYVKLSEDGFHKIQCVCGADIVEKEACTYVYIEGEGSAPNNSTHTETCKCGAHTYPKHTPKEGDEGNYFTTETEHYQECSVCNYQYGKSEHVIKKSGSKRGNLISVDMENHTYTCVTCQKTVTGKHKEFTVTANSTNTTEDGSATQYLYRCPECQFTLCTFEYSSSENTYGITSVLTEHYTTTAFSGEKEFTLTLPNSFKTPAGVEKQVTKSAGLISNATIKLTKLIVPEGIALFQTRVQNCPYLETVIFPEGLVFLYDNIGLFKGNPKLTKIVLPKTVKQTAYHTSKLVGDDDAKPTAYFCGTQDEWQANDEVKNCFSAIKYYGTDWHWEDESKKDTPVDGAKPVALLPTMITTTQARKREI